MELKPVSPTAKAPASNFTGDVYVNQVKAPDEPSRLIVGYVRFTPGARTNWHSQEGYVRLDSLSCAWSFYANRHRGFGTRSQPYLSSLRSCSWPFCWK